MEIQTFSLKKIFWKMSSAKWQAFYLSLSVLKSYSTTEIQQASWQQLLIPGG